MSAPPGLIVTNTAGEIQRFDLPQGDLKPYPGTPRPDKGTRVVSSPPGMLGMRASENLPRAMPTRTSEDLHRPMLARSKRVHSTPAGGLGRQHPALTRFSRPGRPLRTPQKLAGSRWSDVPVVLSGGRIDPLRCHSVDHLPMAKRRDGEV